MNYRELTKSFEVLAVMKSPAEAEVHIENGLIPLQEEGQWSRTGVIMIFKKERFEEY